MKDHEEEYIEQEENDEWDPAIGMREEDRNNNNNNNDLLILLSLILLFIIGVPSGLFFSRKFTHQTLLRHQFFC